MSTFVIILILISSITLIEVKFLNVLGENEELPTFSNENLLVDNDVLNLLVNHINESSEKIVALQKRLQIGEEHCHKDSERITVLEKRLQKYEEHYRETKQFQAGLLKNPKIKRHYKTEKSDNVTLIKNKSVINGKNKSINVSYEDKHIV